VVVLIGIALMTMRAPMKQVSGNDTKPASTFPNHVPGVHQWRLLPRVPDAAPGFLLLIQKGNQMSDDKMVAIVTDASRGIGAAMSE
jgi:hypothetical protein